MGLESVTVRSGETSTLNFVLQSAPSDGTMFTAVVNGMRGVEVVVHVDLSNGLTRDEAERIVGTSFIEVMRNSWGIDWILSPLLIHEYTLIIRGASMKMTWDTSSA